MCPLELVATPMPSPMYRFGGIFRKFGTESIRNLRNVLRLRLRTGGLCMRRQDHRQKQTELDQRATLQARQYTPSVAEYAIERRAGRTGVS